MTTSEDIEQRERAYTRSVRRHEEAVANYRNTRLAFLAARKELLQAIEARAAEFDKLTKKIDTPDSYE